MTESHRPGEVHGTVDYPPAVLAAMKRAAEHMIPVTPEMRERMDNMPCPNNADDDGQKVAFVCDGDAFAALPDCPACGGCGKDTRGTEFAEPASDPEIDLADRLIGVIGRGGKRELPGFVGNQRHQLRCAPVRSAPEPAEAVADLRGPPGHRGHGPAARLVDVRQPLEPGVLPGALAHGRHETPEALVTDQPTPAGHPDELIDQAARVRHFVELHDRLHADSLSGDRITAIAHGDTVAPLLASDLRALADAGHLADLELLGGLERLRLVHDKLVLSWLHAEAVWQLDQSRTYAFQRGRRLDDVARLLDACDKSVSWEAMYDVVEQARAALNGKTVAPVGDPPGRLDVHAENHAAIRAALTGGAE